MSANHLLLVLKTRRRPVRSGILRANGRGVQDDQGRFRPVGLPLFWALSGWQHDRERFIKNAEYARRLGADFIRVLGDVTDWDTQNPPGTNIDANLPGYSQDLADMIDYLYDVIGLRVLISCVGGGRNDPLMIVAKIAAVIRNGRQHKVLYLEVCNEADAHGKITKTALVQAGRLLKSVLPDNLFALSRAPWGPNAAELREEMKAMMRLTGATVFPDHHERNDGDRHWRQVRQPYNFHLFDPFIGSDQEGPPVQANPSNMNQPLHHAMKAFLSWMCGSPFYVVHVGAGTKGVVNPIAGRPANLWEQPEVEAIMAAVLKARNVSFAEPDMENWRVVNNGRADHPLPLPKDENQPGAGFWTGDNDIVEGSVNKNYMALGPGGRFVGILSGVNDGRVGTARYTMQVHAINAETFEIHSQTLIAGETWMLLGRADRHIGYFVFGSGVY